MIKIIAPTIAAFLLVIFAFAAIPIYGVWQQGMSGKAELARAEQNRKIAEYDALATVAKARGVAEANQIIGNSLKDNEAYLRYLWIETLNSGNSEVIYIPTEANLPILEASRISKGKN